MKTAWKNRIAGYEEVDPEQLLANPRNWRIHPQNQQEALEGVLEEVGWIDDIIVNQQTGFVVDGHLRVSLAISKGESKVPVKYVDLTEEEEMIVLATIDPIAAMAATDRDKLAEVFELINSDNEQVQQLLDDIAKKERLELEVAEDPGSQIDKADELQEKWKVERGQIWQIGDHRLMCGDCTEEKDHKLLIGDESIDLVLTDPPYGVGVDYGDFEDKPENVKPLVDAFLPLVLIWPVVLLTPGNRRMWDYPIPTWVLAWVHPAGMGRNPWGFTQLNLILAYGKDPYLKSGLGSRPDTLILATDRKGEDAHPTSKPIDVWQWLMERGSPYKGEKILDPFLGSGTTMVAAEQLNRVCYGMEIEPKYCAVTLERMSEMGLEPKLA